MHDIFMQIWREPITFLQMDGDLGNILVVLSRNRSIVVLRDRVSKRLQVAAPVLDKDNKVERRSATAKAFPIVPLSDEHFRVEAGMYGRDSLSGISAFMGTRESLNASYIQIAGHGFTCDVEHAAAEFQRAGHFHSLALRAVQAQFVQSMQSAGCNAHHEIGPRFARWILLCADRTESATFALSHEFLATMLGARRTTVTVAAGKLKRAGLIRYTRNNVQIMDRPGLEAIACECYGVLREHLRNLSAYDSGLTRPPE